MTPSDARLKMQPKARHETLECHACHPAHRYDTKSAAVDSCLGCHNDQHSLAYKSSPHYRLWTAELQGNAPAGTGVTCATCHLPRIPHKSDDDVSRMLVQHNQNDTLRPNEKMIRPVCLNCHGLSFSIDAMADAGLVKNNFRGAPSAHVPSVEMALREIQRKKPRTATPNAQEQIEGVSQ